jgi:hypothetical protein
MQTLSVEQFQRIANPDNFKKIWDLSRALPISQSFLIAGGAIRRTITGEKLEDGDIDLFFTNEKDHNAYKNILRDRQDFKLISEKDHVDTFEWTYAGTKYEVQLIKIRFYPNAAALLDSFDFTIAQFAMDPNGPRFFCGDLSLYDLGRKRIVLNNLNYPLSSLRRLIKYTKQGYYACNGFMQTYLEEIRKIPDVDFKDRNITYVD